METDSKIKFWEIRRVFENTIDFSTTKLLSGNNSVNYSKRKNGLALVVGMLHVGYKEGVVKSVAGIPMPREVREYNLEKIVELERTLKKRYFLDSFSS